MPLCTNKMELSLCSKIIYLRAKRLLTSARSGSKSLSSRLNSKATNHFLMAGVSIIVFLGGGAAAAALDVLGLGKARLGEADVKTT